MGFDALKSLEIIELMENFMDMLRPDEKLRDQIDFSYRIDDQSIYIYEIRASWTDHKNKMESPIAKTTFIKSKNHWKIYWMRAGLNWYSYSPLPVVNTFKEFIEVVRIDNFGCFWS